MISKLSELFLDTCRKLQNICYVLQWHVRTFIHENMSQQKIAKYLRNLLGDPNFQINHVIEGCFIYKHRNFYKLIMVEMRKLQC